MVSTRIRSTVGLLALLASITTAGCSGDDAAEAASAPTSTAPEREYDFSAVAPIIEAFIAENGLNGAGLVVVEEDEGIVYEQYFGEFGADRSSLVASASKMVTAGVLVRLADEGLLDLDEPIADYVDWAEGHNPEITVAQLLSSSSGLVGLGPNPGYGPYVCQFVPDEEIEECAAAACADPGRRRRHRGARHRVPLRRGAVADRRVPWPRPSRASRGSELLEETYVEPCGVESLGYSNHWTCSERAGSPTRPSSTATSACSRGPRTRTWRAGPHRAARLRRAAAHAPARRPVRRTQVLEPESVERMHTDRISEAYGGAAMPGSGYGLGWWVPRDDSGRINDPGAYGAVPWLDLDGGFGAYLVLEANAGLGVSLAAQLYEPVEDAITAAR